MCIDEVILTKSCLYKSDDWRYIERVCGCGGRCGPEWQLYPTMPVSSPIQPHYHKNGSRVDRDKVRSHFNTMMFLPSQRLGYRLRKVSSANTLLNAMHNKP